MSTDPLLYGYWEDPIPLGLSGDDPDGLLVHFRGKVDRSLPEATREDLIAAVKEAGGHRPDWPAIVKQWQELTQTAQTDASREWCNERLRSSVEEAKAALAAEGITPEQIAEALS